MPLNMNRKDRKLLLGAGFVFLLLVAGALVFSSGQQGQAEYPSSYSSASAGAKAAYLLLSETGYKVERWEKPLSDLPPAATKTLILAEPDEAPTREERERLKAFISEGGHVIATGMFAGTFLPENESTPDILSGMTWKKASSLSPSQITRAAPQIVLAPRAYWQDSAAAYPLYGDGAHTLVVKYPFGRGEVLWWASATPLTNAGLKEPGNLEFVLATFSRRSGPTCVPTTEVRLSPIEFVQTLGGLYERAGTASVVVDICYRRFRYWLTRRLGVAGNSSSDELATAIRDRWEFTDDHFIATLRSCEASTSDPFLQAPVALRLLQELDGYAAQLKLFQGVRKEKH